MPLKLTSTYQVINGRGHSRVTKTDKRMWPILDLEDKLNLCNLALEHEEDECPWSGQRDAAIISILGIFGKRASEISMMRLNDFVIKDNELKVSFFIHKKQREWKWMCKTVGCDVKYKKQHAAFCPMHGATLIEIKNPPRVEYERVTHSISIQHPLVQYITAWLDVVRKYSGPSYNVFVFPPVGNNFLAPAFGRGLVFSQSVDREDRPDFLDPKVPAVFMMPKHRDKITISRQALDNSVLYPLVQRYADTYARRHPDCQYRLHIWEHLFRHSLISELKNLGTSDKDIATFMDIDEGTVSNYSQLGESDFSKTRSQMLTV